MKRLDGQPYRPRRVRIDGSGLTWIVYCLDCTDSWGPFIDRTEAAKAKAKHVRAHQLDDRTEQTAHSDPNDLII